jgi:hypothetical protein
MKRTSTLCRQAGRAIHSLMAQLVQVRLAHSPEADEMAIRRELWQALREHARLDDPNHLDPTNSFLAVWVLTSLLEMEKDRGRDGTGEG